MNVLKKSIYLIISFNLLLSCSSDEPDGLGIISEENRYYLPDQVLGFELFDDGYALLNEETGEYYIDTTSDVITSTTRLKLAGTARGTDPAFTNLTGLRYFTSLEYLDISYHHLENIDLTEIPWLDSLHYTNTSGDEAAQTDFTGWKKSIVFHPDADIKYLHLFRHEFESIDLSMFPNLTYLHLNDGDILNDGNFGRTLSVIDVSNNTKLTFLKLKNNSGAPFTIPAAIYDQIRTAESVTDDVMSETYGLIRGTK